jgi:hypothetical protein
MGNLLQIKLKNKVKIDIKPMLTNVVNSSNSLVSIISDENLVFGFEESLDNDDDDDSDGSLLELEADFIEKELYRLESEESSSSSSEDENANETIKENENPKMMFLTKNLSQSLDNHQIQRDKEKKVGPKKDGNPYKRVNSIKAIPFKNQDINEIRKKGVQFDDDIFKANVTAVSDDPRNDFTQSLMQQFRCNSLRDLNARLVWKRPKVIAYQTRAGQNEFVLDSSGKGLANAEDTKEYLNFFSTDDIYQGSLGDCFMIATLLSVTKNKEACLRIMPLDNALKENMKIGAYHFRLWKVGSWYDVVVDDLLLIDGQYNPLLCKNMSQKNEFWICLLEK